MERFTPPAESGPSLHQAYAEIMSITQQVSAMGRNDYEMSALRKLLEALQTGTVTPKEAIEQAIEIRDRKQDYN